MDHLLVDCFELNCGIDIMVTLVSSIGQLGFPYNSNELHHWHWYFGRGPVLGGSKNDKSVLHARRSHVVVVVVHEPDEKNPGSTEKNPFSTNR